MSLITGKRRWNWRCSRESCKARYHGRLHPDDYKRGWKCKACGGTRFRMIRNMVKETGHVNCSCGAYAHWQDQYSAGPAPHRRGSRDCYFNKDGTARPVPPRKQADRLHPQASRQWADRDQHGVIWWFYDGEHELETVWLSGHGESIAQFCGVQSMLELSEAPFEGGEQRASEFLAEWLDGSAGPCHSGMGRFREDSSDLRRGGAAVMVDWYRAYCRSCGSTPASTRMRTP